MIDFLLGAGGAVVALFAYWTVCALSDWVDLRAARRIEQLEERRP